MTPNEMAEKLKAMSIRHVALALELTVPARAAANQMKDAGMAAGAAPLNEIIFQIDALEQERHNLLDSDPMTGMEALMILIETGRQGRP